MAIAKILRKLRLALVRIATRIRKIAAPNRWDKLTYPMVARVILRDTRFVAVDVGAAGGLLPHWARTLRNVAEIYQIEPRADACRELERQNVRKGIQDTSHVIEAAVSEDGGRKTLYVSNQPTGTSLLPADLNSARDFSADYAAGPYFFPLREEVIETVTLEQIMNDAGENRVDMIKLDVQGCELPSLRGLGASRIDGLTCAELEIGLGGFYPEVASFGEVEAFFAARGLQFFDVRVARARPFAVGGTESFEQDLFGVHANSPSVAARVWEFDAVFFRRGSDLIRSGDVDGLRKLIFAYCVYNFFAEAYRLIEKVTEAGLDLGAPPDDLKQAVVDLHRLSAYGYFLKPTRLNNLLRRLLHAIAPRSAPRWCQYMYQDYPSG